HRAQQVIIQGTAGKLSEQESIAYFNERPYESRLAALASHQSEPLKDRDELMSRWQALKDKYPSEVPKPEGWGGYRITPTRFEFWQGGEHRLHDRLCFDRAGDSWKKYRLNP
ncbi:unnamed protein product, partial [Cyprideis torosa]